MSELLKAWKNGKRGKFRRVDGGKLKFIRSNSGKVEKDAGTTSTAAMASQMGSSADVHLTGKDKCTCGKVEKCSCSKVEKLDDLIVKLEARAV